MNYITMQEFKGAIFQKAFFSNLWYIQHEFVEFIQNNGGMVPSGRLKISSSDRVHIVLRNFYVKDFIKDLLLKARDSQYKKGREQFQREGTNSYFRVEKYENFMEKTWPLKKSPAV